MPRRINVAIAWHALLLANYQYDIFVKLIGYHTKHSLICNQLSHA